jgi:HlyD family secretion protein
MKQLTILTALMAPFALAQEISVSRDAIWLETVKRGPLVRAVRGAGTVANPTTVELKMPADQISEVRSGQPVVIDSQGRSGVNGRVTRVDPPVNGVARVIVTPVEPTSIAPGTSVDGTIELERLNDVVYVGRPAFGGSDSEATLFKIDADGVHASKVRVRFGRPSLETLEIIQGLQPGDRVILSDMRPYQQYDRITLK